MSKPKRIVHLKNIITGNKLMFRSIDDCAAHFNWDKRNIQKYLNEKRIIEKEWAHTDSEGRYFWFDPIEYEKKNKRRGRKPSHRPKNSTANTTVLPDEIITRYKNCLENKDFKIFVGYCKFYSDSRDDYMYFSYADWNEAQKEFEENRCGKDVIVKPRRVGMTTLELCRDLFFALTNPGAKVFVVSQSESTTKELKRILYDITRNFQEMEKEYGHKFIPNLLQNSTKMIEFESGSTIQFETAKNRLENAMQSGRGMSIKRLHCTEVAYYAFPKETMASLLQAAKHASEIVIESTPNGAQGWFYEQYMKVDSGTLHEWRNHFYPWYMMKDNRIKLDLITISEIDKTPRNIQEEFLIHEAKINEEQLYWFRNQVEQHGMDKTIQEYPINTQSCFASKGGSYLSTEDYEYLKNNIEEPIEKKLFIDQQVDLFRYPRNNIERFIMGIDISSGTGGDFSTLIVIDRIEGKIVAGYESNTIIPSKMALLCIEVGKFFNNAQIICERNNSGVTVIQRIKEENYHNLFKQSDKEQYGFWTNTQTRLELFLLLQEIIKCQFPLIQYRKIFEQVSKLVVKNNRMDHTKKEHDDILIAYSLAQYARKNMQLISVTPYVTSGNSSKISFQRLGASGFNLR